ncbi:phasin family protein [Caenimonas soli]|uniref:phasin family protein n=1 Tax=Caenimonas soli TaxID=2735555 RepID=UPI00155343F7|nr:phasin family protein [Caenimonas soli]NPC54099.1 phasin family protein [Caenimonas soli]
MLTDLPRKQLELVTRSATAVYRGSETLRKIQLQAAHRASVHHEEAAEKLRGPCDLGEIMAIQADLLRFNVQEAVHYWQQLASAALKTQVDLVGSAGRALDTGAEPSLEALQQAFAASLDGSAESAARH